MATASRRRFPALLSRRNGVSAEEAIRGTARLGRRTKDLVKRLRPGDVAVIDHLNIDRIAAEELIASGVGAVLNAAQSSDGRYPNAGPLLLARSGIALIDADGADPFELLEDGAELTIVAGAVSSGGREVLRGTVLRVEELEGRLAAQRERVDEALAEFAENTVAHVARRPTCSPARSSSRRRAPLSVTARC